MKKPHDFSVTVVLKKKTRPHDFSVTVAFLHDCEVIVLNFHTTLVIVNLVSKIEYVRRQLQPGFQVFKFCFALASLYQWLRAVV